jgi:hypothetical protein
MFAQVDEVVIIPATDQIFVNCGNSLQRTVSVRSTNFWGKRTNFQPPHKLIHYILANTVEEDEIWINQSNEGYKIRGRRDGDDISNPFCGVH